MCIRLVLIIYLLFFVNLCPAITSNNPCTWTANQITYQLLESMNPGVENSIKHLESLLFDEFPNTRRLSIRKLNDKERRIFELYNDRNIIPDNAVVNAMGVGRDSSWILLLLRPDIKIIISEKNGTAYSFKEVQVLANDKLFRELVARGAWDKYKNLFSLVYKSKNDFIDTFNDNVKFEILDPNNNHLSIKADVIIWLLAHGKINDVVANLNKGGKAIIYTTGHEEFLKLKDNDLLYYTFTGTYGSLQKPSLHFQQGIMNIQDAEGDRVLAFNIIEKEMRNLSEYIPYNGIKNPSPLWAPRNWGIYTDITDEYNSLRKDKGN
jgi:hypothetical protein